MGDWAENAAHKLMWDLFPGGFAFRDKRPVVDALRQARADALEEAAVEAEWAADFEIARNIRDLKDKPACG